MLVFVSATLQSNWTYKVFCRNSTSTVSGQCSLSPQRAHQVMYDRFVVTRGCIGRNTPCDLYNKFVKKLLKHIISSMGSNLTEESLQRAARSVGMLQAIFDWESNVSVGTQAHSTKTDAQDVAKVTAVVMDKKLLDVN